MNFQLEDNTAERGIQYYYRMYGIDPGGETTPTGPAVVTTFQIYLPLTFMSP